MINLPRVSSLGYAEGLYLRRKHAQKSMRSQKRAFPTVQSSVNLPYSNVGVRQGPFENARPGLVADHPLL